MADRVHVLKSLVALDRPLPEILESLRRFRWDSDEDLVILKFEDVAAILDRFLRGELSRADVESWANAIESREDIGFDGASEDLVKDAIDQLANPELSGPLTAEFARSAISPMSVKHSSSEHLNPSREPDPDSGSDGGTPRRPA